MESNSGKFFFCIISIFDTYHKLLSEISVSLSRRRSCIKVKHSLLWTSMKLMAFHHEPYHVLWSLFRDVSNSRRPAQEFLGVSSLLPFNFGAWDFNTMFFDARLMRCQISHKYKSEFNLARPKNCISFQLTKILARWCILVEGWADNTKIQSLENVLKPAEQVCIGSVINSCVGSTLKSCLPPYRFVFS